jgi:hypothetical protein
MALPDPLPSFYWALSEGGRSRYGALHSSLSLSRATRHRTFDECLSQIRGFTVRDDGDDKLRSVVCGVFWLPDGVAINVRQLRLLMGKCKSSVNSSLQKIGFSVTLRRTEIVAGITSHLPFLLDHPAELRKWTIRRRPGFVSPPPGPPRNPAPKRTFEISLGGIARPDAREPIKWPARSPFERPLSFEGPPFDLENWF